MNYRGSSGRGAAFAQAIAADWGHKEVADLLGAVDYAVREKIVDHTGRGRRLERRGILTDYTIASDTRFKAAISGAGSGKQLATYGTDEYILQYNAELQPPWPATPLWLKVSYPFFTPTESRYRPYSSAGTRTPTCRLRGASKCMQRCAPSACRRSSSYIPASITC